MTTITDEQQEMEDLLQEPVWSDEVAQDIVDRTSKAVVSAQQVLVERDQHIKHAVTSLFNRSHVLFVGPPGEAKSLVCTTVANLVTGLEYGEDMFTPHYTKDDIFGPKDGKVFRDYGAIEHRVEGYLAEKHLYYLDEVDKAQRVTHLILQAMNERKVKLGNKVIHMPLRTLVASANAYLSEVPATADRFLVNIEIPAGISNDSSFVELVTGNYSKPASFDTFSLADLEWFDAVRDHIAIPRDIGVSLRNLQAELQKEGVWPSTRRWVWGAQYLQAVAFLAGRDKVTTSDFAALRNILVIEESQRDVLSRLLEDALGGIHREVRRFREAVEEIATVVDQAIRDKDDDELPYKTGTAQRQKIGNLRKELGTKIAELQSAGEDVNELELEREHLNSLDRKILVEMLNIDPDLVAGQP